MEDELKDGSVWQPGVGFLRELILRTTRERVRAKIELAQRGRCRRDSGLTLREKTRMFTLTTKPFTLFSTKINNKIKAL